MSDNDILAQAAAAWDQLETHLIEQCGLPNGAELEAERSHCIAIIVDCIRGELDIKVVNLDDPAELHNTIADAVGEPRKPIEPDWSFPPIDRRPVSWWKNQSPVADEQQRWNKHLDASIRGYDNDDDVDYSGEKP